MNTTFPSDFLPLIVALLCYLLVSVHFFSSLRSGTRIHRTMALPLIVLGLLFHGISLYPQLIGVSGFNFSVFNVVSLTTWLMLCFSLLFTSYRPIIVLNTLAAPLAAAGLLIGFYFQRTIGVMGDAIQHGNLGLDLHIIFSIAAYCVLFMAAVQATLLLLQNRELKHQTHARLWVRLLPALQTMESLLLDMLLLGFVLLSIALSLGAFTVDDFFAQHLAHKTFFSVLSWLLFAYILYGNWRFGWRGKRVATITLIGFGLLALGFIGSKVVLELFL